MSNSVITVSQLNTYVKSILEGEQTLKSIYLSGEISNFTNHYSSGHFYLTLKDDKCAVKSVMFRTSAQKVPFTPQNGMKVICHGRVSLFERDGSYQFYIDDMQPDGIGALLLAYEQLKQKLDEAGLFDPQSKRPLPAYPSKIGVITSATGAAFQDIINVISRRYPIGEILLYPALVQGELAPDSLIKALQLANEHGQADVIIIGRGGGSIEDLWAFNNEKLAYAVFESNIPVISAVGHEIDFTICDFVADFRAPTPSAAAEVAVPDLSETAVYISGLASILAHKCNSVLKEHQSKLELLSSNKFFVSPMSFVDNMSEQLDLCEQKLVNAQNSIVDSFINKLSVIAAQIDATSPLKTLSRGYSIARIGDKVIKSTNDVSENMDFSLILSDGTVDCKVKEL